MSNNCIQETREAYNQGYIASIYQLACACGRISGDSLQTIAAGQTNTVQIKSVRFDDANTPMVDIANNHIKLISCQKVYNVSINVQVQCTGEVAVNTLSLIWFDGEEDKEIASIDISSQTNTTVQNYQLTTLIKSNSAQTDNVNNNYIYAKLKNTMTNSIDITRFRFSVIRAV